MEIKAQLEDIIYNKKEIFPFLDNLTNEELKKLVPTIKKLEKELCSYRELSRGNYGRKGTQKQIININYAGIYSLDYKTYLRLFHSLPERYFSKEIYKKFRPNWLEKYLNENDNLWGLDYRYLLDLILNFSINPSNEAIAKVLCNSYYTYDHEIKRKITNNELLEHPLTLQKHIWFLFEEETSINWDYDNQWLNAFKRLVSEVKIDKLKILKACLSASTKNFNKTLTGYFFDVFVALNPTEEELLKLQNELCIVFNGQHSKPINTVLKYCKTLCTNKNFKDELFLESASILLASEIKSVVTNTLMILDKLAKKQKTLQEQVCQLATEAFIHQDQKIQERTAKLIVKYGSGKDEILSENITMYYTEMYSNVKTLVSAFVEETDSELEENFEYETFNKINNNNLLKIPESFDDIVFFISQVFENNEVYHFDVFLKVLPKLYGQITNDNIHKLEPALKRALKIDIWSSRIGYAEDIMGTLLIDVLSNLTKKFTTNSVAKILAKAQQEDDENVSRWRNSQRKVIPIEQKGHHLEYNKIFIELLSHVKQITVNNLAVEMLSTPTHLPCYLTLEVFVERLAQYQKNNVEVCVYDFQIALARLVLNEAEISDTVVSKVTGEYLDIVNYLTGKTKLDLNKCKTLPLWLIAIYRTKNRDELYKFIEEKANNTRAWYLYLQPEWKNEIFTEKRKEYNYKTKKQEQVSYNVKKLYLKYLPHKSANISAKRLEKIKTFFKVSSKEKVTNFYSHFISTSRHNYIRPHDVPKLLSFSPFEPSIICYDLINKHYTQTSWIGAEEEKSTTYAFPLLSNIWNTNFEEISYLYLACGLLFGKKQGAQIAGELWIKTVSQNNINNELLGQILGKLQSTEYAPMKRLTDLITSQLLNISKAHNTALEIFVSNCISNLGDEPIRGTKKLLEIYNELLAQNNSKANELTLKRLENYKNTSSLKAVIKKITQ